MLANKRIKTLIILLLFLSFFIFNNLCTFCMFTISTFFIIFTLNKVFNIIFYICCRVVFSSLLCKVFVAKCKFFCIQIIDVAFFLRNTFITVPFLPLSCGRGLIIGSSTIMVEKTCPDTIIICFTTIVYKVFCIYLHR